MRSEDLDAQIAQAVKAAERNLGRTVAYWRMGTVIAWDGRNGTNQIQVGDTVLDDVSSLAGFGALLLTPGDTVVLGVADTTVIVLGSVRSGANFQFPILGNPMSLGYGIISQWPTCTSAAYIEMFYALPEVMSPNFVIYISTSIGPVTTAQFRTLVDGVQVDESTVFVTGSGQYQNVIPWPSQYHVGDNPRVSVEAKRITGTNSVSASALGVFAA